LGGKGKEKPGERKEIRGGEGSMTAKTFLSFEDEKREKTTTSRREKKELRKRPSRLSKNPVK